MLLIYTPQSTARLQYICKFIFEEMLGITYSLTLDEVNFAKHDGYKINYSHREFDNSFQIKPHGLLFQNGIKPQEIICSKEDDFIIFFKTGSEHFSFDILSTIFYLISRYEEYLPHEKDMYGRYAHTNSLAHKEGFLNVPLVNIWVDKIKTELKKQYAKINFKPSTFNFKPTYDIDIAWSYKEKGILRNIGGFFKKPSLERLTTLFANKQDPYDCYRFLDDTHILYNLKPIYFFLVAKENGEYDKNILPSNDAMQTLIKEHNTKYEIGIHPSWKSYDDEKIVKEEIETLENISQNKITVSRQHYIKFDLPKGYNKLIELGIKNEYSMGYATTNGFRASIASSYYWYDLQNEQITTLRIHPFCFMDSNSHFIKKQKVDEAYEELMQYYLLCKKYNATLITIFHNNMLGTSKEFEGWAAMYKKFITQLPQ
jgi:hypothetical protein